MGSACEGDEAGAIRKQRLQILGVEIAVVAHPPPLESCAGAFKREPGRDVRVVVHVGNDDLVALAKRLADAEADEADERGRVHAETDFGGALRVDQDRDALARIRDRLVDRPAFRVAPAPLDVVVDEMVGNRIEHRLRDLRAGGIVEEDEIPGRLQRREELSNDRDGKAAGFAAARLAE